MTVKLISIVTLFILTSCNSGQDSIEKPKSDTTLPIQKTEVLNNPIVDTNDKSTLTYIKTDSVKDRLKGVWTDGSSENAVFDIKDNTIFYVDQFASYKYSIKDDIITIRFPDYTYKAKISFIGDTLVMDSEEYGQSKYWKFKD